MTKDKLWVVRDKDGEIMQGINTHDAASVETLRRQGYTVEQVEVVPSSSKVISASTLTLIESCIETLISELGYTPAFVHDLQVVLSNTSEDE